MLFCLKVFLASSLDLYSDEIFYWLASTRPAVAYSDLPFMTALLVGLGSLLDANNTLAVRSLFILMGSSLPLLVYWLALPITNHREALQSALLALCIPMGGFMGLLAVPDVPLIFFGLLSLAFFERALRSDQFIYWIATGVTVALGLSTHYRFFLYPAAAVLFLLIFKDEQKQWRNPKFWIAICVAAIGLVPILWFNIQNQLASASFYLVDRHPWEFQATGLLHVFKQAAVVTPPMYILFGFVLWQLLRRRRSDKNAAMLAYFALTNGAVYLVLAPWTDATSTSLHWPLSAYFPLLVFAPSALKELLRLLETKWSRPSAQRAIIAIPIIGFIGTLIALLGIGSQAFQIPLQAVTGTGVLSNKMAGWNEFSDYTAQLVERNFPDLKPTVVTDNYYTAGQVAFAKINSNPLTLDQDKAIRDGRITQIRLWQMDESGLKGKAGTAALFITEDSTLNVEEKTAVIDNMCHHVYDLNYLASLSLFNGDKQFSFYSASGIKDSSNSEISRANPCPLPPRAWIETPLANESLSGMIRLEGWAYSEDVGIESIAMLMNGVAVGSLNYGIERPDVVEAMAVNTDPNLPRLGFNYDFDTTSLSNGNYTLEIRMRSNQGVTTTYGARQVKLIN